MPILNYTTQVETSKTVGEIAGLLVKKGARKIITDYNDEEQAVGLTFCLPLGDQPVYFSLPCRYEGVLKALQKDLGVPKRMKTLDQAQRVGWRILKDWLEAQLAIVDAGLVEMPEIFLPYAVTKNGERLYDTLKEGNSTLFLR